MSEKELINSSKSNVTQGPGMTKKFIAEVLGTGALLFFPCMVATKADSLIVIAIAFGVTIISLVYSVGNISGAHLNPAASINFLVRGAMTKTEFTSYIIAQTLGAFLGSFLLGIVKGSFASLSVTTIGKSLYTNGQADFYALLKGALIEVILTFFFIFVINGVTDSRYKNEKNAGFVIASAIICLILFGGDLTGTSLNPVRSLSPAVLEFLAGNTEGMRQLWIYFVGPLIGGVLAGKAYDYLR